VAFDKTGRARPKESADIQPCAASEHAPLEFASIERSRLSAGFAFNQRSADGLDFAAAFLLAPVQVADSFAVIGVMPGVDLCFDPGILSFGLGNGLGHGSHAAISRIRINCLNLSCNNHTAAPAVTS